MYWYIIKFQKAYNNKYYVFLDIKKVLSRFFDKIIQIKKKKFSCMCFQSLLII